jgi:polysaccharide export outer membrane protein
MKPAVTEPKGDKLNTAMAKMNLGAGMIRTSSDYKIGPEDLLEIDVFQVQELKTSVRVSAKGYIKLPLVNGVKASGLTVSELETRLAKDLEKFVKEPVVSVFVKEYRSQQISVLGSVKDPRVHYVTGQRYLLDMISLAGGLTPEAGGVCIIQRNPEAFGEGAGSGQVEKIVVDLEELLVNGRPELNIPVTSGDMIHIPKTGVFFVDGAVREPGSFPLRNKMTFTQAISTAKGLLYQASHSAIKVYRDNGKPAKEVIDIDYDAILDGKSPDIEVRDKDIIIVETNGIKSFISGLTGALNFGVFSLGKGF